MIAGRWISFLFVYLPTFAITKLVTGDSDTAHAAGRKVASIVGIGLFLLIVLAAMSGWQPGR